MSSRKVSRGRCDSLPSNAMRIVADGHFSGMKELLSTMEFNTDANTVTELKERAHMLCARFLGGAWTSVPLEHLEISRMKGGMSNMLFLCKLSADYPPIRNEPYEVLLRVYFNPETESHLVAESVIFTLLSERHMGPKLYGIFSGGRLEEYIQSRPLTNYEVRQHHAIAKIARRVAKIHQLDVPIWKEPDYLCEALQRWLRQLSATNSTTYELIGENCPKTVSCDDLIRELKFIGEQISKSKSPVKFCHNDLQEGNILLATKSRGDIENPTVYDDDPNVFLIDFEYASYNYRGFDFANHFVEYTIEYNDYQHPYYTLFHENFPSRNDMKLFFQNYLQAVGEENEPDKVAENLIDETLPFIPVSHFFWGVWGLLQVELSPVGFGFSEYGRDRLSMYYQSRHHLEKL